MAVGRITKDDGNLLLAKNQSEQETLKNRVALNKQRLEKQDRQQTDSAHRTELIKEYADIKTLDVVTVNRLIKKTQSMRTQTKM